MNFTLRDRGSGNEARLRKHGVGHIVVLVNAKQYFMRRNNIYRPVVHTVHTYLQ